MFKDFNIDKFKKIKPPSNNSFNTMQEVKHLSKLKLDKDKVKYFDDIEKSFSDVAKKHNVKNYDNKLVKKIINSSKETILKLKNYFNRPRPKVVAKKLNIKLNNFETKTMKTFSYPSGHSTQGVLLGLVLSKKYPTLSKEFKSVGNKISDSRNIAKAHYKSDSKLGELLGKAMYKHIKNKI